MGIFDWFRRKPPIRDRADAKTFIDERTAFMVQKNIFDYARALSGPYFSKLIYEQTWKDAVDLSRWKSYPLALSAVTEMVHNSLLSHTKDSRGLAEALKKCALEIFDGYPLPKPIGEDDWKKSREALVQRLNGISLHPPKQVKDIPLPIAQDVFDNLPFDESFRKQDFEMVHHHLRVNLITMWEDFEARAVKERIVAELLPAGEAAMSR